MVMYNKWTLIFNKRDYDFVHILLIYIHGIFLAQTSTRIIQNLKVFYPNISDTKWFDDKYILLYEWFW